jgi:tetratricopeptide (TPR) repeat protein
MRRSVLLLPILALFMALSGFDCGGTSAQMSSAKVAYNRKDYVAAEESLRKELDARPQNGAAWFMLAEVYDELGRRTDAMNAIQKARAATTPKLTTAQLEDTYRREYKLWSDVYNLAISADRNQEYRRALELLDTAMILAPGNTENLYFRASVQEAMGDTKGSMATYDRYIQAINPVLDQGLKLGLALRMTPAQVEAKLGAPTKREVSDTSGGYFYYQPQNLYVYFAPATKTRGVALEGWHSFDAATPEFMRTVPWIVRADPHAIVGDNLFKAKDYQRALPVLQALARLDPQREGVSSTITQIYINTNQVEQAIASIRAEIAANPKDARAYLDLGNLYFGSERFNDAAASFNQVLGLGLSNEDQSLRIALFNLGAVYKNIGARLQDSIKRVSSGRPSKPQTEIYFAPLRESVKYFERYRSVNPGDFVALAELGNVYDVLGETARRDAVIKDLEGMASANSGSKEYWRAMSRLYALFGDAKKAEDADRRASSIP